MSEQSLPGPVARPRSERVAIAAASLGALALVAGGVALWAREGAGVFLEVILAGISACF